MKKNVWIIFFSILILTGCYSTQNRIKIDDREWPLPSHSKFKHVEFIPIDEITDEKEGYYIGREDAQNLINNVEELKAYVKKLETLIVEMQEFYKEK